MSGRARGVALGCALALAVAACSSDDEGPSAVTATTASTAAPTSATTSSTTSSTSVTGTSIVPTGASTVDEALGVWVSADGASVYLGPCPAEFDPDFPLDGLCSVDLTSAEQAVFGLGPPFSEIVVYLRLEQSAAGWAVAEAYRPTDPYDLGDAPPWVQR